jgi:hypothetical protein
MTTAPDAELEEKRLNEAREVWCRTYLHVWSDLSRGVYDEEAVAKAADEHWQRSPKSDPVQVAALEFTR